MADQTANGKKNTSNDRYCLLFQNQKQLVILTWDEDHTILDKKILLSLNSPKHECSFGLDKA